MYFPGNTAKCLLNLCNNSNDRKHLKSQYKSDLLKISRIEGNFITCGDFNSRHRAWNCTRANCWGNILNDISDQGKLNILFPNQATYFPFCHKAKASTIDLCLTKSPERITNPIVSNNLSSDHLPIVLKYSINFLLIEKSTPIISKANWRMFKETVSDTLLDTDFLSYNSEVSTTEIDLMAESFTAAVNNAFLKSVPHKKMEKWNNKLQKLNKCSKPFWITTKTLKRRKQFLPCLNFADQSFVTGEEKAEILADTFEEKHKLTYTYSNTETINLVNSALQAIENNNIPIPHSSIVNNAEVVTIIKGLVTRKTPGNDGIRNICL